MKTLTRMFAVAVYMAIAQGVGGPIAHQRGIRNRYFRRMDRVGLGGWVRELVGSIRIGHALSGYATAGPAAGTFYALSDQTGPGTHALTQSFGVPIGATSVILSFDMFVNDESGLGGVVDPAGLDHTISPNQHARVDLLSPTASPFATGAADVLDNFYLGVGAGTSPNPYTKYVFDITGLVTPGGIYQIRFAEVDNQFFFHQGVDNVSIEATAAAVPEPGTLALLAAALLSVAGLRQTLRRAHRIYC